MFRNFGFVLSEYNFKFVTLFSNGKLILFFFYLILISNHPIAFANPIKESLSRATEPTNVEKEVCHLLTMVLTGIGLEAGINLFAQIFAKFFLLWRCKAVEGWSAVGRDLLVLRDLILKSLG